tara:strand:+ start:427 stop:657 length:231 start_codon:yes stop_codon:yes gene_type:complete
MPDKYDILDNNREYKNPPIYEVMKDVKKLMSEVTDLKKQVDGLTNEKKILLKVQSDRDAWKKNYEDLNALYKRTWF